MYAQNIGDVRANRLLVGGRYEEEDEKEEDGAPILTNRWLRELFKKEHRKYYRTPELNDKLFIHYKGFSYMKNLEQFTQLKCLYFEGNGKLPFSK